MMSVYLKKNSCLRVSRFFLAFFLVLFSFQIRTLVYSSGLSLMGNFDPYTSFFLYGADFLLILSFIFWGFSFWRRKGDFLKGGGDRGITFFFFLWLLGLLIGGLFAEDQFLHLLLWGRFGEFFLLYILITRNVLNLEEVTTYFLTGMFFQALIAILQYFFQSSIGLHFLGEPIATVRTLGMAKIDFGGTQILRAFGTFPHANVLGGAMGISLLLVFLSGKKKSFLFWSFLGVCTMALIFSFSRSAFLALGISSLAFILLYQRKISLWIVGGGAGLLLLFVKIFQLEEVLLRRFLLEDIQALQERALYLDISIKMFLANPLGVGLGGFTLQMQYYTFHKLTPWLFQPVHNILLLIANETGFWGLFPFLFLWGYTFYRLIRARSNAKKNEKKRIVVLFFSLFLGMMTVGFFDHYFLTLYAGQVMMVLILAMGSRILGEQQGHNQITLEK